jgi:hypothetical protein
MPTKTTIRLRWLTALLALLLAAPAQALRCGMKVIDEGDHSTRLLRYCGEPVTVQTRLAQRSVVGNVGGLLFPGFVEDVVIEEWTYNFGPHKLMRVVRVENGIVTDIKPLGYGFQPH